MKIPLKDLRPNPFRDLARYPIHRLKIEALKASIRTNGFWDNVVTRRSADGDTFEIAYGHHRLEALRELVNERILDDSFDVDLPVRKLDDAAMIRIMANENVEEYRVTSDIIDETVRVTREYIMKETKTPLHAISASDISQFLGGGWNEDRVAVSLQRLGLFDRGTLNRDQLKGLSHTAARAIQREVAKVEKAVIKDRGEQLDEDEDATEQEKRKIRQQAQKVAHHVAQVLTEHVRNGGSMTEVKEKSLDAQAEMLPEEAPEDEQHLSTIDAAARGISAREFQRKTEMILRYRQYMSDDARRDLKETLRQCAMWCKQVLETLDS